MKRWIKIALVLAFVLMLAGCARGKVDAGQISDAEADCNGKLKLDTKGCILGQSIVSYWTEKHPNVDRRDQDEVQARRTDGHRPADI